MTISLTKDEIDYIDQCLGFREVTLITQRIKDKINLTRRKEMNKRMMRQLCNNPHLVNNNN